MATQRPPLDSYFIQNRQDRPPLDSYFNLDDMGLGQGKAQFIEPKRQIPLSDRLKTAAMSGIPSAVAGVSPESAMKTADIVGPTVASSAGFMMGGNVPAAGAAAGSRAINEFGKKVLGLPQSESRQLLKYGPTVPGPVNDVVGEAGLTYLGGKAADKIGSTVKGIGRAMKPAARRMAQQLLRPGGKRLGGKTERIAETALKEKVLARKMKDVLWKISNKTSAIDDEIESIITKYGDRKIDPKTVLKRLDDLAENYRIAPDSKSAKIINDFKDEITSVHGLKRPVFADVEQEQFVMGKAGKQVNPKLTKTYSSKIQGPLKQFKGKKRFESVRTDSGKFGRSEPKREILTPKKYVDSPEDVVAMNIPQRGARTQRIVTAGPETKYSIRPETFGTSRKARIKIGDEYSEIPLGDAQTYKRGLYRNLEGKKVGGGFGSDVTGADIAARQESARGYRAAVADAVPEENINMLNRRYADLIDVGEAASARLPVSDRNAAISLSDIVLISGAGYNPLLAGVAAGRKGYQFGMAPLAQGLYDNASNVYRFGRNIKSIPTKTASAMPYRAYAALND